MVRASRAAHRTPHSGTGRGAPLIGPVIPMPAIRIAGIGLELTGQVSVEEDKRDYRPQMVLADDDFVAFLDARPVFDVTPRSCDPDVRSRPVPGATVKGGPP